MPNTASTPSAFKHSIIASTARMTPSFRGVAPRLLSQGENWSIAGEIEAAASILCPRARDSRVYQRVSSCLTPLGRHDRLGLRPVHVLAADRADLVGDRPHGPAARAVPARLVALEAVEDRGGQADARQAKADQEPDEER